MDTVMAIIISCFMTKDKLPEYYINFNKVTYQLHDSLIHPGFDHYFVNGLPGTYCKVVVDKNKVTYIESLKMECNEKNKY